MCAPRGRFELNSDQSRSLWAANIFYAVSMSSLANYVSTWRYVISNLDKDLRLLNRRHYLMHLNGILYEEIKITQRASQFKYQIPYSMIKPESMSLNLNKHLVDILW